MTWTALPDVDRRRNGVTLNQVWADQNPRTYLGGNGTRLSDLFINDGPNTGVAPRCRTQLHDRDRRSLAFECLQLVVECGATSIEVTQQAHDAHNDRIEELMQDLIWTHEHRPTPTTATKPAASSCPAPSRYRLLGHEPAPRQIRLPAARRSTSGALRQDVGA